MNLDVAVLRNTLISGIVFIMVDVLRTLRNSDVAMAMMGTKYR